MNSGGRHHHRVTGVLRGCMGTGQGYVRVLVTQEEGRTALRTPVWDPQARWQRAVTLQWAIVAGDEAARLFEDADFLAAPATGSLRVKYLQTASANCSR